MNFFSFVIRRATRHWQIVLTLSLGVLLSTALLATTPLLVNTVVEFGLRRTLLSADPLAGNLRLKAFGKVGAAEYQALNEAIRAMLAARLGRQVNQVVPSIGARWLFPWLDEQSMPDQRVILRFYGADDSDIADHVEFVAGEWPTTVTDDVAAGTMPVARVVIGQEMAEAYELQVGDRLPMSLRSGDPAPALFIEVSGIVRPLEAQNEYWFGEFNPLRSQSDPRWVAQYAALVQPEAFFTMAQTLFPDTNYELSWHVLLAPEEFTTAAIPLLQVQLSGLIADLRQLSPSVTVDTRLGDVLANFATQAEAVRAPLYFLTAEVVLLTLYYVIMVAALAVRQVEREFAILQSRGASGGQIFRIQAGEAVLISLVAFVSGPLLANVLVRGLTIAGPLADVSNPAWTLSLPQITWLAAAVGALACMIGLLLPVGSAVQRTIVTYQQAAVRDTRPSWWQRYYLDVFVLAAGLILLWRLQVYGGIVGGSTARPQVDWLLLLSPVALLLGSGTILLRIFPLILRFIAAIAGRARGLPAPLAMWQAARNPTHVARLVLLLTLAISLGILTTGLNATLDLSEFERSRYTAGSDVRLVSKRAVLHSDLQGVPSVEAASTLWRGNGSITLGRSYLRFDVLAIDPATFAPITHYRRDFSPRPMAELLNELIVDDTQAQPAISLPGKPARFGFWLWSAPDEGSSRPGFQSTFVGDSNLDRIGLEAKLRTAQGEIMSVEPVAAESGGYPADGWRYFEAEIPRLPEDGYPLGLESIWLRNRTRTVGGFGGALFASMELAIDELTVVDAESGRKQVADDLEDARTAWRLGPFDSIVRLDGSLAHAGQSSLKLLLDLGPSQIVSLKLATPAARPLPLPALVSPAFLAGTESQVGDVVNVSIDSQPVQLRLVGQVNYFPTLYEDLNAGYVVTNRDALLAHMNKLFNQAFNTNEALLAIREDAPAESVTSAALAAIAGLSQTLEAETVRKSIKADPMALGLRSVTFFGYILTTLLSLVGFATYFYMSARQRETAYGVLRSIGMSPGQLYGALVLEQVALILAGLAIGTILGVVLNRITLPGLPITFGDRPPTPPFLVRDDWLAVGRIYLTLTIAFFISLGVATTLLWRTQLHRVLRVGEE